MAAQDPRRQGHRAPLNSAFSFWIRGGGVGEHHPESSLWLGSRRKKPVCVHLAEGPSVRRLLGVGWPFGTGAHTFQLVRTSDGPGTAARLGFPLVAQLSNHPAQPPPSGKENVLLLCFFLSFFVISN